MARATKPATVKPLPDDEGEAFDVSLTSAALAEELGLTQRQELFCYQYIALRSASAAFRKAYTTENMKIETVHRSAAKLMKLPKIKSMIELLRKEAAERNQVTLDDLIAELEEARSLAIGSSNPQVSAAIAATMGKAKMLGMLSDKMELTGANGQPVDMNMTVKYVLPSSGKMPDVKVTAKLDIAAIDTMAVVEQVV